MNTYENSQLLPMPFSKTLTEMTDEELPKRLSGKFNYNVLILGLIEANCRINQTDFTFLEERTLKKTGRKRQTFYLNGTELTDEELIHLIDYGYYNSIGKLEKDVGASKNQLRNRYNKAKKKLIQEKRCKVMEIVRPIVQEYFIPAQYTFPRKSSKTACRKFFRGYDAFTRQCSGR